MVNAGYGHAPTSPDVREGRQTTVQMNGEEVTELPHGEGDAPESTTDLDSDTRSIIDGRYTTIARRFRDSWTEEQQSLVRDRIKNTLDVSARLHEIPLSNGDEPEIVFSPYRGGDIETETDERS